MKTLVFSIAAALASFASFLTNENEPEKNIQGHISFYTDFKGEKLK